MGVEAIGAVEAFHQQLDSLQNRAKLPTQALNQVDSFRAQLAAEGAASPDTIQQGKTLLKNTEDRVTLYAFNAAVLAGKTAPSEADLEASINSISKGVETAQLTTNRLRSALKDLSN